MAREFTPKVITANALLQGDVTISENGPEPTHFREDFRRTGPSNYHHGKQAG